MNREDIIEMAREAGFDPDLWIYTDTFERFAALVAAAEREACAQVCEEFEEDMGHGIPQRCANAIRARGEK